MLKKVRNEIDFYLNQYEVKRGNSLDYYCENIQLHPMAIGKYILTLCSLYRSGLITKVNLTLKVKEPIAHLDQLKINFEDKYIFWGLNFSWNELKENERYLITTAIIVQSLCELSEIIEVELAEKSLLSLEYWLLNKKVESSFFEVKIPRYSDNIEEPIYNPGAYAYSVIVKYSNNGILKIFANKYMNELLNKSIFGVGWKYSPSNNTIDLLHNCYISNAYFAFPELIDKRNILNIFSMLNQFNFGKYFLDSAIIKNNISQWKAGVFRYIDTENFLEFKSKEARMWSMGELLIVLSNILKNTKDKNFENLCRKILLISLNMEYNEKEYFRHTMHYTHGLSSFLEVLRSK